ncbi:multidrug resistance protein MdtA [Rubritalea halochordaticola]|uniref:Multidrug resistance protein MdtA n=2 Tax=Rubritalea halochordaticola TaxID=714537 RepID=A0ABP9UY38_9BACT
MHNMKQVLKIVPAIIILAGGVWGWKYFSDKANEEKDKPKFSRQDRERSRFARAQQTLAMELHAEDYPVILETQGIVRAASTTSLTPQVSGKIIKISPHFENGAFFKKGDILAEIDPTDYEADIISAEASLARAESSLAQEQARAAQALRNWKDIGFDDEPNDLVLRKPQLREAEANVEAQKAALEQAKRDLTRTKVRAPYDGRVRERSVGLGQSVGTGTQLGDIFSTSYAEVRLPLSSRQLSQLEINERNLSSIPLKLSNALIENEDITWDAQIVRVEGELDETSRELYVVARIVDPFGLDSGHHPLRINQPVKAHIKGSTLNRVYEIPRTALHGADEVILVVDNKIQRQQINIVWSTQETVLTDSPELENTMLALSRLTYAPEGSPIRIIKTNSDTSKEGPPAASAPDKDTKTQKKSAKSPQTSNA